MLVPISQDVLGRPQYGAGVVDRAIQTIAEAMLASHGKNDLEWLIAKLEDLTQRHVEAEKKEIGLRMVLASADAMRKACDGIDRYHDDAQPYCQLCGYPDGHRADCAVPLYDAARANVVTP